MDWRLLISQLNLTFFFGRHGVISGNLRHEKDVTLPNKFILQPYLEASFNLNRNERENIGSGVSEVIFGLSLRYQFSEKFAPFISYDHSKLFGDSARIVKMNGDNINPSTMQMGIRIDF